MNQLSEQKLSYVRQICAVLVGIIVVCTLLVAFRPLNLKMFWFAFAAGAFGSGISLLREVRLGKKASRRLHASWTGILMAFLFGALMAGIVYFVFVSELLSGDGGAGLLTTNLFPRFAASGEPDVDIIDQFLQMQPASLSDAGKLLVWCFIGGYSERFVTGILRRIESSAGSKGS